MKEIALARGTGGVDEDGITGDEGLMVVIAPKDEDGSAVKVPARVEIAAWEITPAGLKQPDRRRGRCPAEKLRPTWRSGFISTGYFVARAVADAIRTRNACGSRCGSPRSTAASFEADKDITVKVCQTPRVGPPALPTLPGYEATARSASARTALPRSRCRPASRNCRRRCRKLAARNCCRRRRTEQDPA